MLILVVEDEPLVAFAVEWALRIAGQRVLGPADRVEDAIALCQQRQPDLAFIDLNLHDGGDGVDVARYLRQRYRTPCLFLSAQSAHARAHRHLACGFVPKPYDYAALPAIAAYVHALARGSRPGDMPAGLEIFRPPGP